MTNKALIAYSFPKNLEMTSYRVFPPELEDDDHVFFHGTAWRCAQSILEEGFRIPQPPLAPSVSFAKDSSLSLKYACEKRSPLSPDGCVIAVRYSDLTRKSVRIEVSILFDGGLEPPPEIIGYCIVPAEYQHV